MSNIDATLAERGARYGEFTGHAEITQSLKDAMVNSSRWDILDDDMKECLEMVAHKIGRILNGDPNYIDSWTDIIGYTRLVEKRLIAEQTTAKTMMAGDSTQATTFGKLTDGPCDDPACPACHPGNPDNRVKLFEALDKLFGAKPKKGPTVADVEVVLKTLLDAGAISPVST